MVPVTGAVQPRKSASLLVVRGNPPEVLLLQRHAAATFPSMQVFPGGVVEAQDYDPAWHDWAISLEPLDPDERAVRIAGIRETWEEAGMLVACQGPPSGTDRSRPFIDVVQAAGHPLALDDLQDFAHWITPETQPKRFDTRFFLVRAPEGQLASADGSETVASDWITARRALEKHASLMPPTHLNLLRLAESPTIEHAIAAAAARPPFTVTPERARFATGYGMRIPAEAGYPVTEYLLPQQP